MNSLEVPSRTQIMETIEEKLEPIARCCIPYSAVGAAFMVSFYSLGEENYPRESWVENVSYAAAAFWYLFYELFFVSYTRIIDPICHRNMNQSFISLTQVF